MGLLGQLAQRGLGMLDGIALGAEGRIAQTRRTRATVGAVAETVTKTAATTLTRVTAIATLVTLARGSQTGLRAVITAHGHRRLVLQRRRRRRAHGPFFQRRFGSGFCRCVGSGGGFRLLLLLLATDGIVQRLHGGADRLCIATGVGSLERPGGIEYGAIALIHLGLLLAALLMLALEGFVQRLAESIPQLLLVLALQRDSLRFLLPALLQCLDRINAQRCGSAQLLGLVDHGVAQLDAGLLRGVDMGARFGHGRLPARLQFGKHLFADVTGFTPATRERQQIPVHGFPVGLAGFDLLLVACGPGLDVFQQRQAQCLLLGRMLLHGGQPGLDDAVGLVAGIVKTLPERMVGHATLVGLLPLFAQLAQGFLQLARAELAGGQRTLALGRGLVGLAASRTHDRRGLRLRRGGLGRSRIGFFLRFCRNGTGCFWLDRCLDAVGRCRRSGFCRAGFGGLGLCCRRFFAAGFGSRCFSSRGLCCRRLCGDLGSRTINQGFGLLHQLLAQLVGTPALPAFQFAGRRQYGMNLAFELLADGLAVFLVRLAQRLGSGDAGLAVAADQFGLERLDGSIDHGFRLGTALGQRLLALGSHRSVFASISRSLGGFATQGTDLVGPDRYRRQRGAAVGGGNAHLLQGVFKRLYHQLQLFDRAFQLTGIFGIHAGPARILLQRLGLLTPVGNIGLETGFGLFGFGPALGGQGFDALRQQHGGFALDLDLGLQVLDDLDALGQPGARGGQRLLAQRRARLGGITLPGHGIGNIQATGLQQLLGTGLPLCGKGLLATAALDFVQLLAQRLGRALVARTQIAEDFLHDSDFGLGSEPGAQTRSAFAGSGGRKHAASDGIKRMRRGLAGCSGRVLSSGGGRIIGLQQRAQAKSWGTDHGSMKSRVKGCTCLHGGHMAILPAFCPCCIPVQALPTVCQTPHKNQKS